MKLIKDDQAVWSSRGHGQIDCPFDITPKEYINFAEEDSKEKTARGCVNALSNAKRALDSQIDLLLVAFISDDLAKKKNWNIPKKLSVLTELGIVAPRILTKFNRLRNLVEHEFVKPDSDSVEDFIDVVLLFIESTRLHLVDFLDDAQIEAEEIYDYWIDVKVNREERVVNIRYGETHHAISPSDECFLEFMKYYVSLAYKHP